MNTAKHPWKDEEYELLRKRGWRYLDRGLIFLGACLVIGQLAAAFEVPLADLISESLSIAGWVALWRPMEIFLYDLPELRQQKKKALPKDI